MNNLLGTVKLLVVCMAFAKSAFAVGGAFDNTVSPPFKMVAGKPAGCTSLSSGELDRRCHAALKRFAIEHCIEGNLGIKAEEIEDTYIFEWASGGECATYPNNFYVATECQAYYRCIGES